MRRTRFKLWHSVSALALIIIVQAAASVLLSALGCAWLVIVASLIGAPCLLYVATEVIEEVRNARHMLVLLSVVVGEFVVFFAFQYGYLLHSFPESFPSLSSDPVTLLLHSIMIFVFNPIYLPSSILARAVLIINTLGALGLVLFILQNVWQFRRPRESLEKN